MNHRLLSPAEGHRIAYPPLPSDTACEAWAVLVLSCESAPAR